MFKSIVVGTDGSQTAEKAVKEATELASKVGATVHVVSAFARGVSQSELRRQQQEAPDDVAHSVNESAEVEARLEQAAETIRGAGVEVNTHALKGDAADVIIDIAEREGADLIVVGNKGMTGAKRFVLGSVPNAIAHHAPCSVLIVQTTR